MLDLLTNIRENEAKKCSVTMLPNMQHTKDGKLFENPEKTSKIDGKVELTGYDIPCSASEVS